MRRGEISERLAAFILALERRLGQVFGGVVGLGDKKTVRSTTANRRLGSDRRRQYVHQVLDALSNPTVAQYRLDPREETRRLKMKHPAKQTLYHSLYQ